MVWRIGDILDFDEQVAWCRREGFRGVAFHASGGAPGQWQGIDPAAADARRRAELRRQLAAFEFREIHAPFANKLEPGSPAAAAERLRPAMELARDVGASIVTVHASSPALGPQDEACRHAADALDAEAARCGVAIGLEIVGGFDLLRQWDLANIGVTLDVGHVCAADAGRLPVEFRTLGHVVRHVGDKLVHLHVHDYDGGTDHIEIGAGRIDFDDLLTALKEIGYRGGMCLEMNPARVGPEGIIRSLHRLQEKIHRLGLS